ncbi:dolichol kinase [Halarchaeum rubridurum]|uniref:Dolichol kinase n=1 Tax=Halarchaeum rubridurum TaxID=489911 RepID=A0A830G464_9EURY|nr:dolichol kinase [Halarchaeum rubridurum]MBP1955789.1 dolichol kinase [Halarchaeum rubridurum]GGM74518.1 dolichol kinase [Halarchaeum rubridurum]
MPEFGRRVVHASGAVVPLAWLFGLAPWRWVEWGLVGGLALGAVLEYCRLSGRAEWAIYDRLTREYEQENLAGYFLYVVGMAVTGLLFPPAVAAPAMLLLALADPLSGLLHTGGVGRKPLAVMAATFALCVVLAVTSGVALLPAALGALGATLADGLSPTVRGHVVDDNLTIPVVAASAMWVGAQVA